MVNGALRIMTRDVLTLLGFDVGDGCDMFKLGLLLQVAGDFIRQLSTTKRKFGWMDAR